MDHVPDSPFIQLPEDLFRLICEWAAQGSEQGAKGDCCNLALICSQAKSIVEPMIYREIDLQSSVLCELLNRTISHHPQKPPNFFASAVKAIRVSFTPNDDNDIENIKLVLEACTSIREYHNKKQAHKVLAKQYRRLIDGVSLPEHLTLGAWALPPAQHDFSHRIFTNVTHLGLYFRSQENNWDWSSLSTLRHLTHLLIRLPIHQAIQPITMVCTASPRLRLVILKRLYTVRSLLDEEVRQLSEVDLRVVISFRWPSWLNFHQDLPEDLGWIRQYAIPSREVFERKPSLLWREGEAKVEARKRGLVEWPPRSSAIG